jgi:hypothetical protein
MPSGHGDSADVGFRGLADVEGSNAESITAREVTLSTASIYYQY